MNEISFTSTYRIHLVEQNISPAKRKSLKKMVSSYQNVLYPKGESGHVRVSIRKRLDKDFITPIEQKGGTLPEEVTEDKGWRITACGIHNGWAPISLLDEYLQDPIIEEIDYYIELPENYQRCKWLKSKGTEKNYIDCGMPANNETGLMLIAKAASGDTNNGSFGNTYSGTGSLYCTSAGPEHAWAGKWNNTNFTMFQNVFK